MALSVPWCTRPSDPRAWDSEWTTPSPLWKLMPPSKAPIIIADRALRFDASRTAVSSPLKMCRRPSTAMPSQIGWKVVER